MKNTRVWHWFNHVAICAVTMVLVGCPSTSIFNKYKIKDEYGVNSILIDAKQRAIIAVPVPKSVEQDDSKQNDPKQGDSKQGNPKQGDSKKDPEELPRKVFVCAEPSPDAVSVVSSSLEANIGNSLLGSNDGKAVLKSFLKNLASSLGSRNTTIQLLRDGLYRQCEAYLNGVIDAKEYAELANRYVDGMVTLLAIERITPDPINGTTPGSNLEGTEERQFSSTEKLIEPISEATVEAVKEITRAFLNKNLLDECISYWNNDKNSSKDNKTLIEACTVVTASLLDKEDKKVLSNVGKLPEILTALKTNSKLTNSNNAKLGKTNETLGETNTNLKDTNAVLGETNTNLKGTNTALDETNTNLKDTNTALGETNTNLKDTNAVLGEINTNLKGTNTALGETNTNLKDTNAVLGETNTNLKGTNTALDETNTNLKGTNTALDETNTNLKDTNAVLGETNTKLTETNTNLCKINRENQELSLEGWFSVENKSDQDWYKKHFVWEGRPNKSKPEKDDNLTAKKAVDLREEPKQPKNNEEFHDPTVIGKICPGEKVTILDPNKTVTDIRWVQVKLMKE